MVARLVAVVVPLGLDTFVVAAALGAAGVSGRRRRRVSLLMVTFEAGMPLVGLALGASFGRVIGSAAEYLAIAVLISLGLYALLGRDEEEESLSRLAEGFGWSSLLLGLSISTDELAIGFTLGLLRLPLALVVIAIGAQALIVSQLGIRLGRRLSERTREGAERLAGLALTGLGVVLLAERLL